MTALVEDSSSGRHDIIFGTPFLNDLGVNFNYSSERITWDDVSTTMKRIPCNEVNSFNEENPGDIDLPNFMKSATRKVDTINANNYDKYNYRDMVLKCIHLSSYEQNMLIKLFSKY